MDVWITRGLEEGVTLILYIVALLSFAFGFLVAALMSIAKIEDERMERLYKRNAE